MPMSNGLQRTLFALVAGPVFIALLWAGGYWRAGILSLLLGVSMWEYMRILRIKYPDVGRLPETWLPMLAFGLVWVSPWGPGAALGRFRDLAWGVAVLVVLVTAFRRLHRESVFPWVAFVGAGLAYIVGWGSSFLALSDGPRGWAALAPAMMAFGACWTGDTFAYLAGRAFGRHKLCPELSPAKTIEGAVAGVIAPAIFGAFWGVWFLGLNHVSGALLGALLGVAGIVGDLAESVFKRWGGVKDSSQLLPGHGGVLDRFDSAFLAAPLLQFALVALVTP